jgi:hypothetical protein
MQMINMPGNGQLFSKLKFTTMVLEIIRLLSLVSEFTEKRDKKWISKERNILDSLRSMMNGFRLYHRGWHRS